jgi:hypothetical protein
MPVLRATLLAATLAAISVTGASAQASGGTPATWRLPTPIAYGRTTAANLAVRMSDGVTLVGDVMYPTDLDTGHRAPGTFPTLGLSKINLPLI